MNVAHRLAAAGHEVTMFEASSSLGGLAKTWHIGDIEWDRHYHVILKSDSRLRSLLNELELEKDIEWRETRTGCYADGKVHSVSNTLEFMKFPPLGIVERLRLGLTVIYASRIKNWERLEKTSVEEWLTRLSGRAVFEDFWLPLLRSKLGENYRKASAAFIWAIIQRLYKARRTGMKREMFGYVSGGYKKILTTYENQLRQLGVDIITNSPVSKVARRAAGIQVDHPGGKSTFDRVLVATPAPLAARIIECLSPVEVQRLENVLYQGIVCVSLLLDRPLSGFYVTNLTDDAPFTGIIEMSALVSAKEFNNSTLVYLPKYTVENDPIIGKSDEEIVEEFTKSLGEIFPAAIQAEVRASRVSRVRHVLPVSTLGYSESVPSMTTSDPDVFVVNSSQIINGTLNVNETLELSDRVLNLIAALAETDAVKPVEPVL
jgi:protoporphyrinogen oxidase